MGLLFTWWKEELQASHLPQKALVGVQKSHYRGKKEEREREITLK